MLKFVVFITLLTAFLKIISADVPVVLAEGPSEMAAAPVEEVFHILFLDFQMFLTRYPVSF
jgi:hypothetical protein